MIHNLKRKFKGSQTFVFSNSLALQPSLSLFVDLDERFIPYDSCEIINLSTETVSVAINQIQPFILPSGNSRTIENRIIRNIKITNEGALQIEKNELEVTYRNTGHEGKAIINKIDVTSRVLFNARGLLGF